jgi:hypothetical protein
MPPLPPSVTPPPPMSTSSLPASKRIPLRAPAPVKPPVLASDILREEVAPAAPARRAIRLALLAFCVFSLCGAAAASANLDSSRLAAPLAFEGAVGTAIVALIAALLPLPYSARALVAAVVGFIPLALGARHLGPLARLGDDGFVHAAAMGLMATVLPAALVFRARYRAFRAARVILAVALVLSGPALVLLALTAVNGSEPLIARAIAVAGLGAALASTLGFMGPETSGGCAQWAALIVGAYVAGPTWRAASSAWSGHGADILALTVAAVGALAACTLATFGIFQLLAVALADWARTVDVHRAIGPGASESAPRFDSGFDD